MQNNNKTFNSSNTRAQGAIEYLLIIGAAILVVAIVVIAMTGGVGAGRNTIAGTQADVNNAYTGLREAGGLNNTIIQTELSFSGLTVTTLPSGTYFKSSGSISIYGPTITSSGVNTASCQYLNNASVWTAASWDATKKQCYVNNVSWTFVNGQTYTFKFRALINGSYSYSNTATMIADNAGPAIILTNSGTCNISTIAPNEQYSIIGLRTDISDYSGVNSCTLTLVLSPTKTITKNYSSGNSLSTWFFYSADTNDTTPVGGNKSIQYSVSCTDILGNSPSTGSGNINCTKIASPAPWYNVSYFGGTCTPDGLGGEYISFNGILSYGNMATPLCDVFSNDGSQPVSLSGPPTNATFTSTQINYPSFLSAFPQSGQLNLRCRNNGVDTIAGSISAIPCTSSGGSTSSSESGTNPMQPI